MLITARQLMTTRLLTFRPEQDIHDAIAQLLHHRVSGGPVLAGGRLVGILSEKDCLNLVAQAAAHQLPGAQDVARYMKTNVRTVTPETDLLTIADLFLRNSFRRLPVVDASRRVVGQVSRRDVLRGIQQMYTATPRYPDYRAPVEL